MKLRPFIDGEKLIGNTLFELVRKGIYVLDPSDLVYIKDKLTSDLRGTNTAAYITSRDLEKFLLDYPQFVTRIDGKLVIEDDPNIQVKLERYFRLDMDPAATMVITKAFDEIIKDETCYMTEFDKNMCIKSFKNAEQFMVSCYSMLELLKADPFYHEKVKSLTEELDALRHQFNQRVRVKKDLEG